MGNPALASLPHHQILPYDKGSRQAKEAKGPLPIPLGDREPGRAEAES